MIHSETDNWSSTNVDVSAVSEYDHKVSQITYLEYLKSTNAFISFTIQTQQKSDISRFLILIITFHGFDYLMGALSLFVGSSEKLSQFSISGDRSKWEWNRYILTDMQHSASHRFVRVHLHFCQNFKISYMTISEETVDDILECSLCI